MLRHDTHDPEHGQARPTSFPAAAAPWAWVLLSFMADGDIRKTLDGMSDDELRGMVVHNQLCEILLPRLLETWGLPQPEGAAFWGGGELIRAELERRSTSPEIVGTAR